MTTVTYTLKTLNRRNGFAELREPDVLDCIKDEITMKVTLKGEYMMLSPEQLANYKSRFYMKPEWTPSGQGYWLRGYEWNPKN